MTITISVFDKHGNESNEIVLPYEFVSERTNLPLPAPFNQATVPRLGYIDVNLFDPFDTGDPDRDIWFRR
jgi:hypothetical protein